jgi:hypothetical protein
MLFAMLNSIAKTYPVRLDFSICVAINFATVPGFGDVKPLLLLVSSKSAWIFSAVLLELPL